MFDLQKIKPGTYILPKEGNMKVPGLIIATDNLLKEIQMQRALEQVRNVACLDGIVGYSIAMPDIHWGYGFAIGGVAAMDIDRGVISPGGVGYDINCGVRLAIIPEKFSNFTQATKTALIKNIFRKVPSGVGHSHRNGKKVSDSDYRKILEKGALWSIEQGYGFEADLDHIESNGYIKGANINDVSLQAKERGRKQLGTLGSGNHFIEIGEIKKLQLADIAKKWGIEEGDTYVLIHTGSRGFGHQICQDTLNEFVKKGFAEGVVDKQLMAAPIKSLEGKKYFSAMAAAANYAFNNRQQILHAVREAFKEVCNIDKEKVRLLYDVCHNIAKFETHEFAGKKQKLCLHRKGATRAFGPESQELAPLFQETGQPVIVPGDMGRASYLLVGEGNPLTWSSSCHGAGRAKSRIQSMKSWKDRELTSYMKNQGIEVLAVSSKTIAEEMPDAYKDIDEVVRAVELGKLAKIVAKLKPSLVIKG